MKKCLKIFMLTAIVSIAMSFLSFAREGMSPSIFTDKEQVFMYINADDALLKNQWKQVWDNWYYFGDDAKSMQNTWAEIDGKWYYFDQWSIMLHDTTTPDGYNVGQDGAWIPDATASQAMPQ